MLECASYCCSFMRERIKDNTTRLLLANRNEVDKGRGGSYKSMGMYVYMCCLVFSIICLFSKIPFNAIFRKLVVPSLGQPVWCFFFPFTVM